MSNFLLQIENINPLVGLINQLSEGVTNNNEIITKLPDISVPVLPEDSLTSQQTLSPISPAVANDGLHAHIHTKYNLSTIPCDFKSSNPKLNELLSDVYKLLVYKNQIKRRNQELIKILKDYQNFIMVELIPQLRSNHNSQSIQVLKDIKILNLAKLKMDKEVWAKYIEFVDKLAIIRDIGQIVGHNLEMVDDLDIGMKLEAIEKLIERLEHK